jgi:hypothetical protein
MQTIHVYLSAPRLLLKNASTAGVVPSETLTTRLSPKMSRLTPSSLKRRIGTRWLWQRQSQISCKWLGRDAVDKARGQQSSISPRANNAEETFASLLQC